VRYIYLLFTYLLKSQQEQTSK